MQNELNAELCEMEAALIKTKEAEALRITTESPKEN